MELKKKLLETTNISLDAVLEKARALEAAKQQMQCMMAGMSVNAIGKREEKAGNQSGKKCFSCGKKGYSLEIRVVQQKEESVQNMAILLLVAKEIVLHQKKVETANRKELAMAKRSWKTNKPSGRLL